MRADDALKKQKMPFKIFFKSRCDYEIESGWKEGETSESIMRAVIRHD